MDEKQKKKKDTEESLLSNVKYKSNISDGLVLRSKQRVYPDPATSAKMASMIEKIVGGYFCTNCEYTSNHKSHIQDHVQKHIEGLEYPCSVCKKVLRLSLFLETTRKALCPDIYLEKILLFSAPVEVFEIIVATRDLNILAIFAIK